jgi:hypothetical protein
VSIRKRQSQRYSCSPYNSCGSSGSQTLWVNVTSGGGGGGPGGPNIASVSPNPNRGTFTLDVSDMTAIPAGEQYRIIVTDTYGHEVLNRTTRQRRLQLNLQHVPKGHYQLFILYGEASYHHRVVIEYDGTVNEFKGRKAPFFFIALYSLSAACTCLLPLASVVSFSTIYSINGVSN